MSTAIGQTINDVIVIRDDLNAPILLLTDADFATLEAYAVAEPVTTAPVTLDEIGNGEYSIAFDPTTSGAWVFHYVYDDTPMFREETRRYEVAGTAEIVVVSAGGTWTYAGDFDIPRDVVRFTIQDTDGSNPLFVDTEVAYALGAASDDPRRASIALVERLLARYAAMADTTELDLSVKASQLYDHYKDLLETLTDSFATGALPVVPYAGGIRISDVRPRLDDRDRVPGRFERPGWPAVGGLTKWWP